MDAEIRALLNEAGRHYTLAVDHQRRGWEIEKRARQLLYAACEQPAPAPCQSSVNRPPVVRPPLTAAP